MIYITICWARNQMWGEVDRIRVLTNSRRESAPKMTLEWTAGEPSDPVGEGSTQSGSSVTIHN